MAASNLELVQPAELPSARTTNVPTNAPSSSPTVPMLPEPWGAVLAAMSTAAKAAPAAGPAGPSGPWATLLVALATAVVAVGVWLGAQVNELRTEVARLATVHDSIAEVERKATANAAAVVAAQEIAITERRFTQRILVDLWTATYPDRQTPDVPDSEAAERRILLLGR